MPAIAIPQHSTGVSDGAEGFLAFFEPFAGRKPKRDIEIVRIFEDRPWVFCNAYQSLNDGPAQWVTMDMFYTDPGGLILEHWDTIAPYQGTIPSGEDMVGGARDIDMGADTSANKALVLEYTKQVLQEGGQDRMVDFVDGNFIQHSPEIGPGRKRQLDWLKSDEAGEYEMIFRLIGQSDFAVGHDEITADL